MLQSQVNMKAAAGNPNLPQHLRDMAKQAADHGEVALGLQDALERKARAGALQQQLSQGPQQQAPEQNPLEANQPPPESGMQPPNQASLLPLQKPQPNSLV